MRAELARRGLTLETWAAQIREKAQAALARNRRARRMRALQIAVACVAGLAGLAAAAGVALALRWGKAHPLGDTNSMMSVERLPPMIVPDAGVAASPQR